MSQLRAVRLLLWAGLLAACTTAPAPTVQPACDRACLIAMTDGYLAALGERTPQAAGLGPGTRITENGVVVSAAQSVFASARPLRYRQVFADPHSGQTTTFGVYDDDAGPVLYAVRLKVLQRHIVEVEALVNRKGAHPFFAPAALGPRDEFDAEVPAASRSPRDTLQSIADSYFEGIEQHRGEHVPFDDARCKRVENGVQTTDNPQANLPRSCRSGMQMFTYIPVVRDRTYPVIDEERGVVVGWGVFDMPGTATSALVDGKTVELPPRVREPRSMRLAEAFKIVDGRIRTIEAFIRYEPLGAPSGWSH
jgi:hypothetical protein